MPMPNDVDEAHERAESTAVTTAKIQLVDVTVTDAGGKSWATPSSKIVRAAVACTSICRAHPPEERCASSRW